MRLVPTTSASRPNMVINASQRAIRARITPCMAGPPNPSAPLADEFSNSVQSWRRNRGGNEQMHRQIDGEARRIAANTAKLRAQAVVFVLQIV